MSHTTRINSVKITNVNAMRRAVQRLNNAKGLNLEFVDKNAKAKVWERSIPVAFAVNIPGVQMGLNVGFEGDPQKGYTPVYDYHGGWIGQKIGGGHDIAETPEEQRLAHIGGLMQAYAHEVALEVAGQANAMVDETFNAETGEVVLLVA